MFASEVLLPKLIEGSSFATSNPESANFFLVKHYSTCYYHECLRQGEEGEEPEVCKGKTESYLREILVFVQQEYSYWNITPSNHLLIFSWAQASEILGYYAPLRSEIRDAIHLTTLGSVNFSFFFFSLFSLKKGKKKKGFFK